MNKILLLLCCFIIFSCKKDISRKNKVPDLNNQIELIFPDTVVAGNYYSGKIVYSSALDTITKILYEKDRFRHIQYAYTGTRDKNYGNN